MIRTINGAVNELKKQDPQTPISAGMLRRWIRAGQLPAVMSGNKYLLNMETVNQFLKGTITGDETQN